MQACVSFGEIGCAVGTESEDDHREWAGGEPASVSTVGPVGRRERGRSVGIRVLRVLPGDHRAGLRMAGGGGGGAELREATVARLQAGHGTPVARDEHPKNM